MIGSIVLGALPVIIKFVLGLFMSKEKADKVTARVMVYVKDFVKNAIQKASKLLKTVRKTAAQVDDDQQKLIDEHKNKQEDE